MARKVDKEKIAARNKAYYEANKETSRIRAWDYRIANKEKIDAKAKARYEATSSSGIPEKISSREIRSSAGVMRFISCTPSGIWSRTIDIPRTWSGYS